MVSEPRKPPRWLTAPLPSCGGPGPLENFRLGMRVLGDQLLWAVLALPRAFELRQLRQRLKAVTSASTQHDDTSGELSGEKASWDAQAGAQVAFLKQEIANQTAALDKARLDFLKRRSAARPFPWL